MVVEIIALIFAKDICKLFFVWKYFMQLIEAEWRICIGKITIIGSDNSLAPGRRQAMIWTNAGILLIGPLGTSFGDILIKTQTFSMKKIRLKMSSTKCSPFLHSLNVLNLQAINATMNTNPPTHKCPIRSLRCLIHVTVTSQWAQWCLKSQASGLFALPLAPAQTKESIKPQLHWSLWGKSTDDRRTRLTKGQ